MATIVIGSDLGSSGCKSVAVDVATGAVLVASRRDYPTISSRPGWAEQDPERWFEALTTSVSDVASHPAVAGQRIAALCIIGVTHTAVLLDADDRPLAPSILMFDSRSQLQADAIRARMGDEVERRTLNSPTPVWTWPQLAWVRENQPEMWAATRRIVLQKDYVRERLGSGPVTDFIDAAGTLLFDPIAGKWIPEFLDDLQLDSSLLPEVTTPWQVAGRLSETGADATGLPVATPLVTGTTDTVAEMVGSGALRIGQGVVKLASVGRVAIVHDAPIVQARTLNYRHLVDNLWYPGTASKYAASAYRWLRDTLWRDSTRRDVFHQMDTCAAEVPAGSAGLLFHPHLDGQWAPLWDDVLRASFLGLTNRHGRAHLTRAVLEGVGLSIKDALVDLERHGLIANEFRLIGQGSVSRLWSQVMTDILDRPLGVPAHVDAAYGAAVVGAIGAGLIDHDPTAIEAMIEKDVTWFEPNDSIARRYEELFSIYQESLGWQQKVSAQLTAFENTHREDPA